MNKLFITFFALLLSCGLMAQETEDPKSKEEEEKDPYMTLDEIKYNFGDIRQGETAEHIFTFVNSGTKPLEILEVITTCECVVTEWPGKKVTKGKTGAIKVVFNSGDKVGRQNKLITIVSNAENAEEKIILSGNVLPKEEEMR